MELSRFRVEQMEPLRELCATSARVALSGGIAAQNAALQRRLEQATERIAEAEHELLQLQSEKVAHEQAGAELARVTATLTERGALLEAELQATTTLLAAELEARARAEDIAAELAHSLRAQLAECVQRQSSAAAVPPPRQAARLAVDATTPPVDAETVRLRSIYADYDRDGNGFLSASELHELFRSIG
ncbi:hypothetical protein KFE25_006927 [Diacronema lutheri]|uniref:EF-hand domain-containing protein n=1 Tax=Diacronema lutheri TaxID=2081491 RepID=A0A8J5XYL5_DIALT|nr:hypothetical protein KFE25_006927 [Diacronema lutheri]